MSFIAVVRMQGGSLIAIKKSPETEDKLMEWPSQEQADKDMEDHILAPLGYEIIEVAS